MKRNFIMLAIAIFPCLLSAQVSPTADEEKNMKTLAAAADTGWSRAGTISVGVTGAYFNQWAAGGINSVGINGLLNYGANYRDGKNAWDNTLIVAYGMLNQGFTTSDSWVKTDDRFDFTSKYGRPIKENLYYAALLNFNTQFAPGYAPGSNGLPNRDAKISNFLAPARLLLALGLDYKPKPELSVFFSPATYRGIYVFDELLAAQGAFGVEKGAVTTLVDGDQITYRIDTAGATARHEVGAYLRVNYAKKFTENFNLTSKLELFSNYLDKPGNIDLAWETIAAWKLGKYFSVTTSVNFLYDDNTNVTKSVVEDIDNGDGTTTSTTRTYLSKGLQTRIVSTLGLTYNF